MLSLGIAAFINGNENAEEEYSGIDDNTKQVYENFSNLYHNSNLTTFDETVILESMIKNWTPLSHLGYNTTLSEALSHRYDHIEYNRTTVSAYNNEESILFSIYVVKNVDASYSIDTMFDTFHDCYINDVSVDADTFEQFFCDLIVEAN